jgi:ABC-type amino acid transport substrate-binding protein
MFPIAYANPITHELEGLAYQIAFRLGEHLGIPVNLVPDFPWARMMEMTREGKLDIIAGVVSTSERTKFLDFTVPFYHERVYAFALNNANIELTRLEDLLKFRRVEARGASMGEHLDTLLKKTTIVVNNQHQRIALIVAERADYFLASESEFITMQSNYPKAKKFKKLPFPIKTLEIRFGVSKFSPCIKYLAEFNQLIGEHYPEK